MKYYTRPSRISFLLFIIAMTSGLSVTTMKPAEPIEGSWQMKEGTTEQVLIIAGSYFMLTSYDKMNKRFYYTRGGTCTHSGNKLKTRIEFSTKDKEEIGTTKEYSFLPGKAELTTDLGGKLEIWKQLDDGKGALCGNWRITDRMQGERLVPMPLSPRRTLKILSGTRFQWSAINIETREFFGTGGGTYTFANGEYTEHIEFFSRDSTRVGASLKFQDKAEGDVWTHTGLSSRGDKIHELWGRMK